MNHFYYRYFKYLLLHLSLCSHKGSNNVKWQLTNKPMGATVNLQVWLLTGWEEAMLVCQTDQDPSGLVAVVCQVIVFCHGKLLFFPQLISVLKTKLFFLSFSLCKYYLYWTWCYFYLSFTSFCHHLSTLVL